MKEDRMVNMKIQIEKDTFLDALNSATRAVSSRAGTLPVLSGVQIVVGLNEMTITGSDLDITVRVNVMAHTEGEGSVVLSAKLISEIVRSLEAGTISMDIRENVAVLTLSLIHISEPTRPY